MQGAQQTHSETLPLTCLYVLMTHPFFFLDMTHSHVTRRMAQMERNDSETLPPPKPL